MRPHSPLLAAALARPQPIPLTRPLFAAILAALVDLPRGDARRGPIEALLDGPQGPDWHGPSLSSFIGGYAWHLLCARSARALAFLPPLAHTTTIPPQWRAAIAAMEPQDMDHAWAWAAQCRAEALLGALVSAHLADPAWAPVWDSWNAQQGHRRFFIPSDLVTHPHLHAHPTQALAVLEQIAPRAQADTDLPLHAPMRSTARC